MSSTANEDFYTGKSWGAAGIADAWDLPTLKLRYLMRFLGARSRNDVRLLEVGCGSGRILRSIRDRDGEIGLTGVDRSEEQLAQARAAHTGLAIAYEAADGSRLPFENAAFDIVVFFDYLEHITDPRASLSEMFRVLVAGGSLHFVCPCEGELLTPYRLSRAIFKRHFKEQTLGHIQQFSFTELETIVRAAGFEIAERRYSYHLLGSIMDYVLFAMLLHPGIARVYWNEDKYHRAASPVKQSLAGRLLNGIMTVGNAVAYVESNVLRTVPVFASAIHITARKPPRDK